MIGECISCGEDAEIVGHLNRDPRWPLCAVCCDEDYRDDFTPGRYGDEDQADDGDPLEEELFMERQFEKKHGQGGES